MKNLFILFFLIIHQSFAQSSESKIPSSVVSMKEIKIDDALTIKYNDHDWEYHSLIKNLNKFEPHYFFYKQYRLRLVFESVRLEEIFDTFDDLIKSTCAKENMLFKETNSGSAEMESINGVPTCYTEHKVISGNLIHSFIFPETEEKKKNKLYKFSWTSTSKKTKKVIISFIEGFIK